VSPRKLSLPQLVVGTAAVTAVVTLATMGYGWLSDWPWVRVYRALDRQLFLAGGSLFLLGVLGGKPQPPDPPEGLGPDDVVESGPRPPPPTSGELSNPLGAEMPPHPEETLELSEQDSLGRLRQRAGALMVAGVLLIVWSAALHGARPWLQTLYGGA